MNLDLSKIKYRAARAKALGHQLMDLGKLIYDLEGKPTVKPTDGKPTDIKPTDIKPSPQTIDYLLHLIDLAEGKKYEPRVHLPPPGIVPLGAMTAPAAEPAPAPVVEAKSTKKSRTATTEPVAAPADATATTEPAPVVATTEPAATASTDK